MRETMTFISKTDHELNVNCSFTSDQKINVSNRSHQQAHYGRIDCCWVCSVVFSGEANGKRTAKAELSKKTTNQQAGFK